jgi:hypothetical protein
LPLLHDLRFERALPVPQHVDTNLARGVRAHVFGRVLLRTFVYHDSGQPGSFMPEVLGYLLVECGFQHVLGEQLQHPVRPGQRQPAAFASATIAAAAACSGDSSRSSLDPLLRGLARSDALTHRAHPAGPRPCVSGRRHRSWNSPDLREAVTGVLSEATVRLTDTRV